MHFQTILLLLIPTTLATRGLTAPRVHGLDVCVKVCSKVADGETRWDAVCETCMFNSDGKAAMDPECRECAKACRHKNEDPASGWICGMCFNKGANRANWDD